jgi:hypothetical protein
VYYYVVLVELGDETQKSFVFALDRNRDLHQQLFDLLGESVRILDIKILGVGWP